MQRGNEQLIRQQEIMRVLGYYKGLPDGIWGPDTVEAKKKWELSGKFAPGLPNFGLPLANKGPWPRGVYMDKASGLLTCGELEASMKTAAEHADVAKGKVVVKAEPTEEE